MRLTFIRQAIVALLLVVITLATGAAQPVAAGPDGRGHGHYANVNGLRMYYEVHGKRRGQPPLVLLHGGFSSIRVSFGDLIPALAKKRQVIAIEQQAHGRTADIDRPLRYPLMADDTVELLRQLGIRQADFFGYSVGAAIALDIGIRHPDRVRKLVFESATWSHAGLPPGYFEQMEQIKPENFYGTVWYEEYQRIAPRPQDFPVLVEKMKGLIRHTPDNPASAIRGMRAPTLVAIGDTDIPSPVHAAELFRLRGGGFPGDGAGGPAASEFTILPGNTHVTMEDNTTLAPMVDAFLARPMPS